MTDRETTAPLADAVNQLSTLLTRVNISDGAESAISPFDGTYSATQFFQTFDRKMEDASMEEQEKLLRLPNYLVRQPLELFRKLRLADRSYFQVRQILLDLYPESSEASFAKYFAMKLTGQANLETYYREKTAMGLQLGLPQEVILETLTEGLPFSDQRLVRVVPPENLGEWFRLVQRIHGPSVPATRSREDQPPTMSGLYQPTRLPFGLKTSPQIYERAISQVLQRHGLDCVAHYFDDFIIYSNTLEEHQNHLRQFFAFCEAEKLQLNFAKCEFFKQSINFLGYTITAGTITPLTRNTDIIHAIKQPHNRKTLQSFLGAVNVYNKFIPEYARLRAPLNNLLKKDVVWNWNEACQEAFIDLKGNLTQHPILHLYKEGLPCQVYCDASTLGIAGILKQVHPDGNVYPVQYFSRTLRPHEKNYSISELECLAIVESVEKFRIYLMGRKFTIFSDHHALQWLKTIKNPSGRLFRWSLRLSSYEYEVRYIKGKLQYEADLLSRNPFCGFLDATLIKTHQPPPSKESSLTIDHNGLHTVSRKGVTKIILPKPLIQQLLQTVHTQYNHPGISQMSRIISTQYYWQGMSKDIKQKVKTCPTCQLTKRPVGPTYGELSQPPESKEPFDLLSLDTIAGFAKYGNTKIYLHVVVDHFSRYAWAFPSKSTSTTTYQQVLKRVFQDGSPKRLLTDRAPAFTSPKFRSFLLNRNIHPLITTSNNPQANGLCERLNATLTGKLRLLHLENPKVAWTKLVKKCTQSALELKLFSIKIYPGLYIYYFNVRFSKLRCFGFESLIFFFLKYGNTFVLIAPSHIFTLRRFNLRRVFLERNPDAKRVEKDTKKKKMAENPSNRLQKFNGSKSAIRPESWIKLYDFENNSLKEDEKIKNLMYYLTDSALEWYADEIISNPAIKRWEVVKEKLIQRFGSYNANPIVSASHRRLKREESIENYFQDKIRLLNQTHLTKEEKIHLLTDGLPNDWKDLIVAAQPTDTTKWFHIAASIEQNRASIKFKPKNKIHLATKNNDNRKNVCPFWCPICSKKGIKIKHWVTDCEDYDPNYKKDRPNQNTSVKQVCGAPELLNVSTLTNTPTQGAFKLINISVEVNGIPAQAFVDTGATVSIINWRLFKRTRLQLQPNSDIHISQADGVTRTCGSLQTKVRIDKLIKPVTLHVMKNFKYPLLIGLDVASLFNLLIDVRDKTIYTKIDGLQNPILVNHLEEIREHELKELLEHNRNVFSQHAIDLGKVAIQHKIITKSEQPISLRPYRRPLKEYEEIAEQVKELLEHKLIRTSDSPWAFPVVMVPKKDGIKRMCIDYRRLNEITLDDRQPLPHIQDMFDRLHGSRFFSTLDVAWGYWQIEMDPQSIQKTAFVTNDGHYEFLVMPFGLKNAASTFQRIIQHILGELLWKGTCSFQDDILVYTKTWQEHIELLSKVFDKLRQYNMKLKLSKCIFGRTEVKYLGHIISHNQLKPDPGKVKSIQDFPRPDTVKKVRQFMGLANYYRKFVKDFSKISFPLVRLTRKNQPFIWNEEVEESFAKLKMALSTKPVLAIYNPDYPSKVYTDASKYGIGAILTQIGPDNEEHVIAYYSKTLQPHQENYSAYEMECLAVIQATDHFHVYIENQPFEIITDHAALQWLFTMKKPKPKYFRWILSLSSKSCNIVHRSGKQQTHVDALSRLPVVNIATQELQEHQQNSDLSFLKNSHAHDGVVMIKQKGVFKAVVPNSLTKKILEEYHDSLSHPSITKTCKLITQCYWWKGITTDIKNYVRSCKSCQLVKVRHEPTLGEMITPTSNIQPLQMIGCDTIVLGTAAANTKHKFIQVFVDHATRYLWAYPTITNTAQAVTQCLDKMIKSVNSINTILTDNGKNFISKEFNKFLSLQGIKHTYTSPYHPQCNGICEKLNDTIMTKLRIAVLEKPRCKWSTLLPQVVKNYNSTPHDVTVFSPLFLMYGISNVPEFADQTPITIEEARKKASLRTEQSRSKWKIKHDSHHPKYVFKEGDLVIRKIAFNDPRLIKTSPKYEGPFVIQKKISDVTYDISLKDQEQARRVHISQLRPFITRE
ncbi:K02A2.6-like [Cordylochernes scorpioides]|uniref:RNA-directed DNA polymerase n=1 Tax=Cordylochernes scorpioides TaxID=51811 RepID=A0ABY6KV40_9ARAC|nr:K02A2.6-like [Cordylochernes scorpioides]